MSNRARIKVKKPKVKRYKEEVTLSKKYTSFNIFTRDGQNLTVTSERPMTIEEALYHYNALSISGND
jgi:hypothetical protein